MGGSQTILGLTTSTILNWWELEAAKKHKLKVRYCMEHWNTFSIQVSPSLYLTHMTWIDPSSHNYVCTLGAPQWRQAPVDNSDLSGIPDRFQWEGFPGGRKVVMLNADVAMVRQLDDSNRDPETGEVSCKFVNRAPGDGPRCPVARSDLFDRMVEYSQSNTQFLNDFRDAMIKMTDTGYRVQSSSCDADGMCRLIRN